MLKKKVKVLENVEKKAKVLENDEKENEGVGKR